DAVGVHNPFVENNGLVYGIDAPQLAGNRLDLRVEYRKAERTRVDAPHGVGADVVPSEHSIDGKQAAILPVAHVDDVAAPDDHAAVGVEHDPAHAAPLRHDGRDLAFRRAAVHAAAEHVAEVQVPVAVDRRPLDEPVPGGQRFHHARDAS